MSTGEDDIDPEILMVFVEEAQESIAELDARFVAIEENPGDGESLAAIFRVMHTVKGNSAFFGLMKIKKLAHQMEDLMALMREGSIAVSRPAVQALLKGLDLLRGMLDSVQDGEKEFARIDPSHYDALVAELQGLCEGSPPDTDVVGMLVGRLDALLSGTSDERALREGIRALKVEVAALSGGGAEDGEKQPDQAVAGPKGISEELFELVSMPIGERLPEREAIRVRELLVQLAESEFGGDAGPWSALVAEWDAANGDAGVGQFFAEGVLDALKALAQSPAAPNQQVGDGRDAPKANRREAAVARTMRVEEGKIDQFLDYVGELIIVREMFVNVGKMLRENSEVSFLSANYQRALEAFTLLSHSLQGSIMEIRKVPVKVVLQKVPRLARDLAEIREKNVKVVLEGESVPIDKSLLESLEGPLTHMVRNAVDHGIEGPSERTAVGKPAQGTLLVRACEDGDAIRIDVQDDGGGINAERLKAKAMESGILTAQQAERMSDQEAYNLLFAAGLSTAKEVTDISGRGVGMDVVKRNVTDLGGEIRIDSALGRGTTFTLLLPKAVTVQILDGFLVRVSDHRFVLPLMTIRESFRPSREQLVEVAERGEFISRRGQVFPLVRFGDVLELTGQRACPSESIVVSVDLGGETSAGLLVDEVLGVQQVVLREVSGIGDVDTPFAGGAVLGDGRVAMVLDVERLGALV